MEAKNLRVGNWVKLPQNQKPFQITVNNLHAANTFRAITLSEYWLELLGFEKGQLWNVELWSNDMEHESYTMVHDLNEIHENVNEVHQLQNLFFAITGEELEIKDKSLLADL